MPCTIFISTSGTDRDTENWVSDLKHRIAKYCKIPADEIYWYKGSRLGTHVESVVRENAESALILLCLVTDAYLVSPWCVREHGWFCTTEQRRKFAVAVLAYGLKDWPNFRNAEERDRFFKNALENVRPAISKQFPSNLFSISKYAEHEWYPWLISNNFSDLRECENVHLSDSRKRSTGDSALARLLEQIRTDVARARELGELQKRQESEPEARALRAAASLSAFALAADRYCDGGWGFSTAEDFAFDEDGDELVRGRYDLNVIVLRALEVFLEDDGVRHEWEKALGETVQRQPRRFVKDRLPSVARFLACFERSSIFERELWVSYDEIAAELNAEPPTKRWGLDSLLDVERPGQHHIVLHQFAFHSQLLTHDKAFVARLGQRGLNEEIINRKVDQLEQLVTQWLKKNNIFWDFINPDGVSVVSGARKDRLLRSILWCLLSNSNRGLQLLANELSSTGGLSRFTIEGFPRFQSAVENTINKALENPASSGDALVFTLVCAYVLQSVAQHTGESRFTTQLKTLQTTLNRLLVSPQMGRLVLQMNSLGWAVLILIANNVQTATAPSLGLDIPFLRTMWEKGRELRRMRVLALNDGSVEELKEGKLQTVVCKQIDDLIEDNGFEPLIFANGETERLQVAADLKRQLLNASFWGRRPSPGSSEPELTSSCLAGVLQVRSPSGRIDVESEGYSRLFLHPFSELTNMNVFDLMGVRRELGDKDTTLVEKMGAVVVEKCYERAGNRFRESNGFKERTDFITMKLKAPDWPRHRGFDDLLQLRKGKEGHRWVYRTALVHPEYGDRSDENTREHMIAWHFVEVPDEVIALIGFSSNVVDIRQKGQQPTTQRSAVN